MAFIKVKGKQIELGTIDHNHLSGTTAIPSAKLADGANFLKKDGSVNFSADQSMGGFKLTNLGAPVLGTDAATKSYVDGTLSGLDIKASCRVATTAPITLSGLQTIDGVSLIAGNRVLVKNQVSAADNGIYVVAAGAWARSDDAVQGKVSSGMFTFIEGGATYLGKGIVLVTADPITIGTTELTFSLFSDSGSLTISDGLDQTGSVVTVKAYNGIEVSANGVGVKLDTNSGLTLSANGLKLAAGAMSDSYVTREQPAGTYGVDSVYTLAYTPVVGSEMIFMNGILLEPGAGKDYTISGASVTFAEVPAATDIVRATYLKA